MSAPRFFCAAASRTNREAMFGTVALIESWLLIEYSAPWRPRAIEDSVLPEHVKRSLDRIARGFPTHRQLFIRQSHSRSQRPVRCFFAETREFGSYMVAFELQNYEELATLDVKALARRPETRRLTESLYLVCTHGTHDKCCALFGLPVYTALHVHAGGRAWECSHVGGDRFAANVVCLPEGVYYGHVEAAEAADLADEFTRGELSLEHYRGRSCYPRAAQVAEYFLRRETGIRRIDAFRLLDTKRPVPDHWRVRFAGTIDGRVYTIEFRALESLHQPLTCGSDSDSPVRQYYLIDYSSDV